MISHTPRVRHAAAAILLAFAGTQTPPYEVAVAGEFRCPSGPIAVYTTAVEWMGGAGAWRGGARVSIIAAAPDGLIYGIAAPGRIVRLSERGDVPLGELPQGHRGYALTVSANGTIYVLVSIPGSSDAIDVFDPDGTFRRTRSLGLQWYAEGGVLDLAADQCTLYVGGYGASVRRFDVCSGTLLPQQQPQEFYVFAMRVLPDGGLLIWGENGLERLDREGASVRTYKSPPTWRFGVSAIGLADGGRTAWAVGGGCGDGTIDKIDLETGDWVQSYWHEQDRTTSVVPWRPWTAAIGNAVFQPAQVPTASVPALLALFVLVAFAAARRLG